MPIYSNFSEFRCVGPDGVPLTNHFFSQNVICARWHLFAGRAGRWIERAKQAGRRIPHPAGKAVEHLRSGISETGFPLRPGAWSDAQIGGDGLRRGAGQPPPVSQFLTERGAAGRHRALHSVFRAPAPELRVSFLRDAIAGAVAFIQPGPERSIQQPVETEAPLLRAAPRPRVQGLRHVYLQFHLALSLPFSLHRVGGSLPRGMDPRGLVLTRE